MDDTTQDEALGENLEGFVRRLDAEIEQREADAPEKVKAARAARSLFLEVSKDYAEGLSAAFKSGELVARYRKTLRKHVREDVLTEDHVVRAVLELLVDGAREMKQRVETAAEKLEHAAEVDESVADVLKKFKASAEEKAEGLAEDDAPG